MTARDVYDQLKAKGRPVTLRVITTTGAVPSEGNPGTEAEVDYATYAVEESMTFAQRASTARALGNDIAVKDRRYMLAPVGIASGEAEVLTALGITAGVLMDLPALDTSMKLVDGEAVLSIIDPGPFRPASTVLYYSVEARGS
jgi:hypothetical protein